MSAVGWSGYPEDEGDYEGDWQTCPSCGRRFDAADDSGLGFGGCPEGNCVACENCCRCEDGDGLTSE